MNDEEPIDRALERSRMLYQIIQDQLPRHIKGPDGAYRRSFDAKIFLDRLIGEEPGADMQERAVTNLSMVGVFLKAGLALADISCTFSQEPACQNLQQLRDKMKGKRLGKDLDYETVTVILTEEQMRQLRSYYTGVEQSQMRQ